jgi:hypothetical protein
MPPLDTEFSPRFRAQARALPAERQKLVADAVAALSGAFGKPHLHSGLGIRRLKRDYFECRPDRDTRMVFKLEGSTASLMLVGSHDDVQRFLKNR